MQLASKLIDGLRNYARAWAYAVAAAGRKVDDYYARAVRCHCIVKGKVAYMAPEQARAQPVDGEVPTRALDLAETERETFERARVGLRLNSASILAAEPPQRRNMFVTFELQLRGIVEAANP